MYVRLVDPSPLFHALAALLIDPQDHIIRRPHSRKSYTWHPTFLHRLRSTGPVLVLGDREKIWVVCLLTIRPFRDDERGQLDPRPQRPSLRAVPPRQPLHLSLRLHEHRVSY